MSDGPIDAASKVIDLRARFQNVANPAEVARAKVRSAREVSGLTADEFAGRLSAHVDWKVSGELVTCWEDEITPPGDILVSLDLVGDGTEIPAKHYSGRSLAGVEGAYRTRGEFIAATPVDGLFDAAHQIHAVGISHNLLCQQYPNPKLVQLVEDGASVELLFLKPDGEAIAQREEEEGYEYGDLSSLTKLNLSTIRNQVRSKLSNPAGERLAIGTYDEVIRFSLIFIDGSICVMQPYLHSVRGLETPTFVLGKQAEPSIFDTMWTCYEWLRERTSFR